MLKNPTAPARNAANRSRSRVETVSITTGRSGSSKLISAVAAMPSRHVDVHEHEVEPIRSKHACQPHCLLAIRSFGDDVEVWLAFQYPDQPMAECRMIVCDQNA